MRTKSPKQNRKSFLKWFNDGTKNKTSWEWMELIIIPLSIAFIVGAIEILNSLRQQKLELEISNYQGALSQQIKQQETLEKYLEKMTDLLINHQLLTTERHEILSVAQGLTFTALTGLDSSNKKFLLRFLYESQLIGYPNSKKCTAQIIKLNRADLKNIDIGDLNWQCVNLLGADLRGANLKNTILSYSDLRYTNLSNADLSNAQLENAQLDKIVFCNTTMPDSTKSKQSCK
ncbi:MAG: pentapeptide repeat-containing protein [Xenococcaceae cyanobacterium MO_188.B29]|nr:pentapeptide repeat-containing protein [Xenococcaceae cyanobacterium MO_188.B29]